MGGGGTNPANTHDRENPGMKEYSKKYKQAKDAWSQEDMEIKGEIARYFAVKGITRSELAKLLQMKPTTFYSRCKNPSTFSLEEYRRLKFLLHH